MCIRDRVETGDEAVHRVALARQLAELANDLVDALPEGRGPLASDACVPDIREQPVGLVCRHGLGGSVGKIVGPRRRGHLLRRDWAHAVSYTHLRAHETDSYLVCR